MSITYHSAEIVCHVGINIGDDEARGYDLKFKCTAAVDTESDPTRNESDSDVELVRDANDPFWITEHILKLAKDWAEEEWANKISNGKCENEPEENYKNY